MAVTYIDRKAPASPELIDRLEQQVGRRLPDDYRDYLLRQDGGSLDFNSEGVQSIFGLGEVPGYASIWENLQTYHDRVPRWLLPVASNFGGNIFAISLRTSDYGSVWFWDHEEEADEGEPPAEDNIELKAPSWSAFLEGLQPIE